MSEYPYAVYEFRDGKLMPFAHNLFLDEAEGELGNVRQGKYRKQAREHRAEDAETCAECIAEIAEAE